MPVVYNCGGYESVETLRALEGLVDIYLPDFKYSDAALAKKLSAAPDYPQIASAAILEMHQQVGGAVIEDEQMTRGVIIRHLVLPGCRRDSCAVLGRIARLLPVRDIRVSVMSQYTPDFLDPGFALPETFRAELERQGIRPALRRRLTDFEYRSVLDEADRLGITGYRQGRASAQALYTPDFKEGIVQEEQP